MTGAALSHKYWVEVDLAKQGNWEGGSEIRGRHSSHMIIQLSHFPLSA